MDIQRERVANDPQTGSREVVRTHEHVDSPETREAEQGIKSSQWVWYIIGIIEALLALRIIFHLLSARQVGFTDLLYSLSNPFVAPFRGIFPAPSVGGAYFDVAALVAMVIIALIGWAIVSLIDLSTRPAKN